MIAQCRATVLLTRPADAARRFAALLDARAGRAVSVLVAPLMAPRHIDPGGAALAAVAAARGLLFTSETGVVALARIATGRDVPAFCVGTRTAAAARGAGWRAEAMGVDAAGLVAALADRRPTAPLVHVRGRHAAGDIAGALSARGLPTTEAVVYEQVEQPLDAAALALLAGTAPVVVPLFSPRSAALFARHAAGAAAPLRLAAISAAAARPLAPREVAVAAEPTAEALAETVLALLAAGGTA
jgi:uroporphyrinogen-III synthase